MRVEGQRDRKFQAMKQMAAALKRDQQSHEEASGVVAAETTEGGGNEDPYKDRLRAVLEKNS